MNQRAFGAGFNVMLTLWAKGSLWYLEESVGSLTHWVKTALLKSIATEGFLFYCELGATTIGQAGNCLLLIVIPISRR